jgi:hypothetical protein
MRCLRPLSVGPVNCLADNLRRSGRHRHLCVVCEVADRRHPELLIARCLERFGSGLEGHELRARRIFEGKVKSRSASKRHPGPVRHKAGGRARSESMSAPGARSRSRPPGESPQTACAPTVLICRVNPCARYAAEASFIRSRDAAGQGPRHRGTCGVSACAENCHAGLRSLHRLGHHDAVRAPRRRSETTAVDDRDLLMPRPQSWPRASRQQHSQQACSIVCFHRDFLLTSNSPIPSN